MKRLSFFCFFIFLFSLSLRSQEFSIEKKMIDKDVREYVKKGMYINASDLLLNFALRLEEYGDTASAYEYFIQNGHLIDAHIDEMLKDGFTTSDYVDAWFQVFISVVEHKYDYNILQKLFSLLRFLDKYDYPMIPHYMSDYMIQYQILICNDNLMIDSIRYYSQRTLDIIKTQPATEQNVIQYIDIYKNFCVNRELDGFKDDIFVNNYHDEITEWYQQNKAFIESLDYKKYNKEIKEYEMEYVRQIELLASTEIAQNNNISIGIQYYHEALDVLFFLLHNSIDSLDSQYLKTYLFPEIAYCYTSISTGFSILNLVEQSKVYCDSAISILLNHPYKVKFESIQALYTVALNYYRIRSYDLAASLHQKIIELKKANELEITLSDWSTFFMYINKVNPYVTLLYKNEIDSCINNTYNACDLYSYYMEIAEAYFRLAPFNIKYPDTAAQYLTICDSLLLECERLRAVETNSYKIYSHTNEKINHYNKWSRYYAYAGNIEEAYRFCKKSIEEGNDNFSDIAWLSSYLKDTSLIHQYLPLYFRKEEKRIVSMLPVLGSLKFDSYLQNGETDLYHFPEWALWNPTDSVCVSTAYDATLLMKGLTLRYSIITPYFENHPQLINTKLELDRIRDSIYSISDNITRVISLHEYELKEREILEVVYQEMSNTHWTDIFKGLNNDEACIEFVKYTANTYICSGCTHRTHYVALILIPNNSTPILVDLFDEDELMDVYNLQPKSYDTESGQILYSKIWGKLQQYIDGKSRVYFSPMGLLNLINIELLTDSTGTTATERYNLYRVSSTRNVLTPAKKKALNTVASFGGVDYNEAKEYACVMDSINTRGSWAFLQNTLPEVMQIKSLLTNRGVDVTTFTGTYATEDAFKRLDGTSFSVIHIASHGYYIPLPKRLTIPYFSNSDNTKEIPDELFYSGLILSGGQRAWVDSTFKPDNDDGILSAYEISKLDLHNVDLVVLSACETGLGDNLFDGIYGLQRAFKKAGVKSILMSLWQIDDKSTSEYMGLFYEKLADGLSIHDAYVSTTLAMKEKYKDANYWASFVLLD